MVMYISSKLVDLLQSQYIFSCAELGHETNYTLKLDSQNWLQTRKLSSTSNLCACIVLHCRRIIHNPSTSSRGRLPLRKKTGFWTEENRINGWQLDGMLRVHSMKVLQKPVGQIKSNRLMMPLPSIWIACSFHAVSQALVADDEAYNPCEFKI